MSLHGAIILLFVLCFANYWSNRSVLYPPFLFSAMWFFDLFLYQFNLEEFPPPHANTLNVICLGAAVFSGGGLIAMLLPRSLVTSRWVISRFPPRNKVVKPALVIFLACGIPLAVRNLFIMAAGGGAGSILQRARNGDEVDLGIAGLLSTYFMLWALYTAPLFLLEKRDKKFWAVALIAFMGSVLSTGRVPIFMLFTSLTCVSLMSTNRERFLTAIKFARVPIFLFFCLYIGLIFVVKDLSFFEGGIVSIAVLFFVSYIIGPTAAFDYSMQHPQEFATVSNHTFKFFLGIGNSLHLVNYQPVPHDDFLASLPFPTNVYTVYRYYMSDFGLYGTVVTFAVYGLFQSLVYRKARSGSMLGMYFFAASLYVTFMSIFSDEYASFGAYIDMLAYGAIYIFLRSLYIRVLPGLKDGFAVRA
jgi:oligosaccharide repeat unit polymerase